MTTKKSVTAEQQAALDKAQGVDNSAEPLPITLDDAQKATTPEQADAVADPSPITLSDEQKAAIAKQVDDEFAKQLATRRQAEDINAQVSAGGYVPPDIKQLVKKYKPGLYICAFPLPDPDEAERVYPAGASFKLSANDLKRDWIAMQVVMGAMKEFSTGDPQKTSEKASNPNHSADVE